MLQNAWGEKVKVPTGVNYETAAGSIIPGIRTYSALYYHHNLSLGEYVLILRGAHVRTFFLFFFFY